MESIPILLLAVSQSHINEVLNLLMAQGCGSHTAQQVIDSPQLQGPRIRK
jgi:hypothetical protein